MHNVLEIRCISTLCFAAEFAYPAEWLADQTIALRMARRAEEAAVRYV